MYAYVDESGNTGQNIFDEAQPHFLTAALVTRTNFDVLNRSNICIISKRLGVPALHANDLGLSQIEQIADDLRRVLKKSKARFIFSNVEKRYLAMTKIVDYVFDAGENPAVPWQIYNLRLLRLLLLFKLSQIVDIDLAKRFWSSLMEPNKTEAYRKFVAACRELLTRVDRLQDKRLREVASESLQWAINNPEAINIHSASKESRYQHLPNMVAFTNLLDGIERQSKSWKRSVKLIVHDEQMQFERNLKRWHELFSNASPEPLHWPGEKPRVLRMGFGSNFVMSNDKDSPGIQVIDILIWLFRQMMNEVTFGPHSARLINFALSRAWYQDLSFKTVSRALEENFDSIYSTDIPEEQMETAFELIESDKQRRQKKIEEYANNKLFPNN